MKLWKVVGLFLLSFAINHAAEPALSPMPVCDALAETANYEGKAVTLVGRYSYRKTGKWMDQEGCGSTGERAMVVLTADSKAAPMPPEPMTIDEEVLLHEMTEIKRHTALGKFRFGSEDYDRWAVVFGRLESRPDSKKHLVYRGDGAVYFIVDR